MITTDQCIQDFCNLAKARLVELETVTMSNSEKNHHSMVLTMAVATIQELQAYVAHKKWWSNNLN